MLSIIASKLILTQVVIAALPASLGALVCQYDPTCSNYELVLSCFNTTVIENTCCAPTPGGLILQTQFWDTYTGLEDQGQLLPDYSTWTLHGLWTDLCDGSYTQYCDPTRQFDPTPDGGIPAYDGPGVDTFIEAFGRYDLLDFMRKFWVNRGAPNKNLWAHEFSKHATCFSTFDTACYEPYVEHVEVIDFFDSVRRAYNMFPTGAFLESYGIVPSSVTTYTLSALEDAVQQQIGAIPFFGCTGPEAPEGDGRTILNQAWYYNYVVGTPQTGEFKHIDSIRPSSCTATGQIWYPERPPWSVVEEE